MSICYQSLINRREEMYSIHILQFHQLTGKEEKIFVAAIAPIERDLLFLVRYTLFLSCTLTHIDHVFIFLGIGVGVVFILLGFTVYLFLSCINDKILEPELDAENVYINAKSGNINSAQTSSSAGPLTSPVPPAPGPSPDPNYYPVTGRRRRQVGGGDRTDRYDRHGRALAPSCLLPLLALVTTAAMCFISILVILCYLSSVVNS